MFNNSSSYDDFTAALVVPAGAIATVNADARVDIYGTLSGGGTLNLSIPSIRTSPFADWSAFTGSLNATTASAYAELRMSKDYNPAGFPNAAVSLGNNVTAVFTGNINQGAGTTIAFGALSGAATSKLLGGPEYAGARLVTYRIGAKGIDATFAGSINEQNPAVTNTSIVKTGAGTWTLSGACDYNGGTTVEQGTLKISGSVVSASATNVLFGAALQFTGGSLSTDAVNIAAGAQCNGHGTITGDLNNNGTLTVGTGGTLTVNGDVVNNGTMRFTGGSALAANGAFVNHGTLDLLTSASALPANLENYGVIIDSTSLRTTSAVKAGNTVTLSAITCNGHVYQLQRADFLVAPTWQNVGAAKAGNDAVQTFGDAAATGTQRFYRLAVTP